MLSVIHFLLLFANAGHATRTALAALLKIQIDLGVLRSLSIRATLAEDLLEDTLVDLNLASEDLLIYRVLASA